MSDELLTGTAYLQIRRHYRQARVVRATQTAPETVAQGCVVVKLRFQLPDEVFLPLETEAIVIRPELVQPAVIEAVEP